MLFFVKCSKSGKVKALTKGLKEDRIYNNRVIRWLRYEKDS